MKSHALRLVLACLWCWATLIPLRALPLWVFAGGSASESGFVPYTAVFDGTNDYINLANATFADGKAFTCSFWYDHAGSDGSTIYFVRNTSDRFAVFKNNSNQIALTGKNGSNTTILSATSTATITAAGGWYHIYITVDLNNSSNRAIYVNGSSDSVTWTTYTNDTMDLANTDFRIGAGSSGANKINGTLCEFWLNDSFLDNVAGFRSGALPASVGSDGSTPLGSQPAYYFSRNGGGDAWATNAGSAGNGTVVGALTEGTPP